MVFGVVSMGVEGLCEYFLGCRVFIRFSIGLVYSFFGLWSWGCCTLVVVSWWVEWWFGNRYVLGYFRVVFF